MYVEDQGAPNGAGTGWTVEPDQVRDFANAVDQVRAHLNAISSEVNEMSTPSYSALLGTSPVGQELSEKFNDRMGSDGGLRGQLQVALQRMEEFVTSAEKTAAAYQAHDEDSAQGLRYS